MRITNFYQQFIENYSYICILLTALSKKNQLFLWPNACQIVFKQLKKAFTILPILANLDSKKQIILETDILNFILAKILLQYLKNDTIFQPMAYFSIKHTTAKCNYKIYNKKLLAIIQYFEK